MHIKQFHQGGCLLQVFPTDLALLAVVLRHAASSEHLLDLSPLMSTTLEGLATAFETGTLMALQQTGNLRVEGDTMLTAEQVQGWCQRVVVEGVDGRVVPSYTTAEIANSGVSGGSNEE